MPKPITASFCYWEENASGWLDRLSQLKASGVDEVHSWVPWGAHESIQGIRDFSKVSKLRLERFLSLAHHAGLTVRLDIGFPPQRIGLPTWVENLGESTALIPAGAWRVDDLSLSRIPSIHEDAVFIPFLEFVSDVFAILSLYRFPEGPVVGVRINWGIYEWDFGVNAFSGFAEALQRRYQQISLLNVRYRTAFKDFITAASPQGVRTLIDKRPWLASFDYKLCRAQMLVDRTETLLSLPNAEPLVDLLSFTHDDENRAELLNDQASWAVVMDPVQLEGDCENKAFLFSPMGAIHPQMNGVFRLWEYLKHRTQSSQVSFRALDGEKAAPAQSVCVVAGRFLSRAHLTQLMRWAESGTALFFPLGLPQYDEQLISIDWRVGQRNRVQMGEQRLGQVQRGSGSIFFAENPAPPQKEFWDQIRAFSDSLSKGAPL